MKRLLLLFVLSFCATASAQPLALSGGGGADFSLPGPNVAGRVMVPAFPTLLMLER